MIIGIRIAIDYYQLSGNGHTAGPFILLADAASYLLLSNNTDRVVRA